MSVADKIKVKSALHISNIYNTFDGKLLLFHA